MVNDDSFPIDDTRFIVTSHVYFIAPFPRPSDGRQLVQNVLHLPIMVNGQQGTVIPIFTDLDLAERFLARADNRTEFKPLTCPTTLDFAKLLHELMKIGETHVLVDPDPASQIDRRRLFPIVNVIEGIAEARLGPDASGS